MQKLSVACISVIVVVMVLIGGCLSSESPPSSAAPASAHDATPVSPTKPATVSSGSFTLNVASVPSGATIPDRYTCKGASESPGVSWNGIPAGAKSLVLILDDPDAPSGTFTHWIVYNIPPQDGSLAPAQTNAKVLENGAQQGETTTGSRGYYPLCPPVGTTHRYVFRLYAVDMVIPLPTADRDAIDAALNGHTLVQTEVTTTFTR